MEEREKREDMAARLRLSALFRLPTGNEGREGRAGRSEREEEERGER